MPPGVSTSRFSPFFKILTFSKRKLLAIFEFSILMQEVPQGVGIRKRSQHEKCSARGICSLRFSPFPKILSFVIKKITFTQKTSPRSIGGTPGSQNWKKFTSQEMFAMGGFYFEASTVSRNFDFCNKKIVFGDL